MSKSVDLSQFLKDHRVVGKESRRSKDVSGGQTNHKQHQNDVAPSERVSGWESGGREEGGSEDLSTLGRNMIV